MKGTRNKFSYFWRLLWCKRYKNPHEKISSLAWGVLFWKSGYAGKYSSRKTLKSRYWKITEGTVIWTNRKHARFKFGVVIQEILLFSLKSNIAATFWQFFGHKLAKCKIFKIDTSNLWNATQGRYIPNMFPFQVNVHFVSF